MQKRDIELILKFLQPQERRRVIQEIRKSNFSVRGFSRDPAAASNEKIAEALFRNRQAQDSFIDCIIAANDNPITDDIRAISDQSQIAVELAKHIKANLAIPDDVYDYANSLVQSINEEEQNEKRITSNSEIAQQLTKVTQENKTLKENIDKLQAEKKALKEKRDELKEKIKNIQNELNIKTREIESIKKKYLQEMEAIKSQNLDRQRKIESLEREKVDVVEQKQMKDQQYEELLVEHNMLQEKYEILLTKNNKKVLVFSKSRFDIPSSIRVSVSITSPDFSITSIDFSVYTYMIAVKSEMSFLELNQLKKQFGSYLQVVSTPGDLLNYLRSMEG